MVGEPCEPRRERPVSLRRTGCRLALLAMLLTGVVGAFEAHAQGRAFDKLVMPGPLASAHAKYESECATCHVRFERSGQTPLCLDCHKEIARDLAAKTGFHSRSPDVAGKECSACHSEHKGRDGNLRGLDELKFDHRLTDFALLGRHAQLKCGDCHRALRADRRAREGWEVHHLPRRRALQADAGHLHRLSPRGRQAYGPQRHEMRGLP
jgi:hypothetical protein